MTRGAKGAPIGASNKAIAKEGLLEGQILY